MQCFPRSQGVSKGAPKNTTSLRPKLLFLKTALTADAVHREINADLAGHFSLQAAEDISGLPQHLTLHYSTNLPGKRGPRVHNCYGATNRSLIVSEVCSTGGSFTPGAIILVKSPWWMGVIGTGAEPANAVKLTSKDSHLYHRSGLLPTLVRHASISNGLQ